MTHAGQQTPHFCRNNREIASALGLRQSRKQLAEIGAWRARADFPKKTERGYDRTELLQWSARYAKELAQLSALSKALSRKNTTARDLRRIEELAGNGHSTPTQVTGQPAIAAIIAAECEMLCQRYHIQRWRAQAPEPFPAPDPAGRYDVARCLEWVRRWKLRGEKNGNGQGELYEQAELARQEIAIIERDRALHAKEAELGQWIRRTEHERILSGLGKEIWTSLCNLIERELVDALDKELRDLGLAEDRLSGFMELVRQRHHAAIDNLQKVFEKRIAETS